VSNRPDALTPDTAATVKRGRIEYIDGIRGIGAILVAIEHPLEIASPAYAEWSVRYVNLGRVGIVAFFLVSGYVVGLTLSQQSARAFGIRRFWRLYPVYWISTLLLILVMVARGEPVATVSTLTLIANIVMVQGFVGLYSIHGAAWTLGIEIAFYAQSVFGKIIGRLGATVWLGLAWLTVFGVLGVANRVLGSGYTAVVPLMMFTASLGYAIYRWEHGSRAPFRVLAPLALICVPIIGWLVEDDSKGNTSVWTPLGFNLSYAVGIAVFAVFYALRNRDTPSVILWLGSISYALYLIHVIILKALTGIVPMQWLVFLTVAISLAAATILHRVVERPSISLGRRLSQKRSTVA
jgi:peptidoglycan/LPS O-acetylase OafA/YrhL